MPEGVDLRRPRSNNHETFFVLTLTAFNLPSSRVITSVLSVWAWRVNGRIVDSRPEESNHSEIRLTTSFSI